MTKQLKPWQSFQDQLENLVDHGLLVDNPKAALNYLQRIGYYRLSGYWYPMRMTDKNRSTPDNPVRSSHFIPGSHFEDAVRLYVFDKKLRLLALDALERIEMALRVDIAHLLGKLDPLAHENPSWLNPSCLHGNFTKQKIKKGRNKGKTEHDVWMERYRTMLWRARDEQFVKHHKAKYGGKLPVWVAIEIWDFGMVTNMFDGLRHNDQETIASRYGAPDTKSFSSWLSSLNYIRNVAAHHSRLWNINVLVQTNIPPGWDTGLRTERPFLYFCLMQQMLNVICPNSTWADRLEDLIENHFPKTTNGAFTSNDFGLIEGWKAKAPWRSRGRAKT